MKIDKSSIVEPKPTEDLIKDFEEGYRVKLPDEFKRFLLEYNGAIPITDVFVLDSSKYIIQRFLCLLDDYEINEFGIYDMGVVITPIIDYLTDSSNIIGLDVIPIVSLVGGDFICLDYRKNENPIVVIWDKAESEESKPVIKRVADSITEFFDMLIEDEDDEK